MQDSELARPVVTLEYGKVLLVSLDPTQHPGRLAGRHLELENSAKADEVYEYGLAFAPVTAVAGMLSHVRINYDAMSRRIPKT